MYRSLVVPLDGSSLGEHALPLALTLARRTGASLRLLHVMVPFAAATPEGPLYLDERLLNQLRQRQRTQHQAYLDGVVGRLQAAGAADVRTAVLEGDIPAMIRQQAEADRADLIVMTTHGRGPLARFWLGSVADDLVRQAPCPLLLTHPREEAPDLSHEAAVRRVLVPLDGSPLAEQVLGPATVLAQAVGAALTLLRVVRPVLPAAYPAGPIGEMTGVLLDQIDAMQGQLRTEATQYLDRVAAGLRERGFAVTTKVDLDDQPAAAILREAAAGVDLVALHTHGRRGLARLFLGSVADKVVRGCPVPVLVLHPPGQ